MLNGEKRKVYVKDKIIDKFGKYIPLVKAKQPNTE